MPRQMATRRTPAQDPRRLAAIDLGSNSFHLLVANYHDGELQVVAKQGEKVQLAAGLDEQDCLSEAAIQRALDCLARFAPFLDGLPATQLRVVGTNALRAAANSQALIGRAQALLGQEVEIIAGREEARLIYLGAAHALADVHGRRLIADIGGGSTEFIIGENFEPLALESLDMGCVTYTQRFFTNGDITEGNLRRAELAALSELANIRRHYRELGWSDPVGSSGTIKAAAAVLAASGECPEGVIERRALLVLRKRLIRMRHLDRVAMNGLKQNRAAVFPAGVAILCAIFEAFELDHMRYSDGALREGVLYDLAGRHTAEDTRLNTLVTLRRRYGIDERQADNVATTAREALVQVEEAWQIDASQGQFLDWAGQLHEIGLAISHSQFHRHGAYLLENSDLSGFSRPEQQALAFLVRAHRRKFPLLEYQDLAGNRKLLGRLARLLRLAVILNRSRPEAPVRSFLLRAQGDALFLTLDDSLRDQALLINDLEQEAAYQRSAGFQLTVEPSLDAVANLRS